MIKKFNHYINENYEHINKPVYSNDEIVKKFQNLLDKGYIKLGNRINKVEELLPHFIDKKYKYPEFGFESMMIELAEKGDKGFISAANQQDMGKYIDKIKESGIDVSKLEKLYPYYKEYHDIDLYQLDNVELDYDLDEDEKVKVMNNLYNKMDELKPKVEEFEKEIRKISKKISDKL